MYVSPLHLISTSGKGFTNKKTVCYLKMQVWKPLIQTHFKSFTYLWSWSSDDTPVSSLLTPFPDICAYLPNAQNSDSFEGEQVFHTSLPLHRPFPSLVPLVNSYSSFRTLLKLPLISGDLPGSFLFMTVAVTPFSAFLPTCARSCNIRLASSLDVQNHRNLLFPIKLSLMPSPHTQSIINDFQWLLKSLPASRVTWWWRHHT